jgi:hypothetical protein
VALLRELGASVKPYEIMGELRLALEIAAGRAPRTMTVTQQEAKHA